MAVTVASLMTPEPVVVEAGTDVLVCARLMESREIGTVGVVMDGRLSGVLTDRDIVTRAVARNRDPRPIPVSELATSDVITVPGDAGHPIGIISADDLTAFRYPNSVVAEQLGEWGLGLSDQGLTGHA
jgi:predicted transcriptional regulator